jgi:hypothetical protein
MLQLGHDNPEFFFQPFRYQAPVATHIERFPTRKEMLDDFDVQVRNKNLDRTCLVSW